MEVAMIEKGAVLGDFSPDNNQHTTQELNTKI